MEVCLGNMNGVKKLGMINRIKHRINLIRQKFNKKNLELKRIYNFPRFTVGSTNIFGKPFTFHDSHCFINTYKEIFEIEIYKFHPSSNKNTIIDCGANMGLSVAYFSYNYPNHTIIAFEPDKELYFLLKKNINSLELKNVVTVNKAVWDKEEKLEFYTDGGMGGRVNNAYPNKTACLVDAVPLRDYIDENISFLKIDIEGAEDVVLRSCKDRLKEVENIFFEYHSKVGIQQTLHELFQLIKDSGFRYYIKESATRRRPFVDTELICDQYDMAINIFCYKINK